MLVDFRIAAAVVGESKKIAERHVRHETCEGELLQDILCHVIRQRYVLHTQVAAVFQIVAGVLLVETYTGNVGLLSGNSPALEHASALVTAVGHTLAIHARYIIYIITYASLEQYVKVESLIAESIGQAEGEIRVWIADVGAVAGRNEAVVVGVLVNHFTRLGIYSVGNVAPE